MHGLIFEISTSVQAGSTRYLFYNSESVSAPTESMIADQPLSDPLVDEKTTNTNTSDLASHLKVIDYSEKHYP